MAQSSQFQHFERRDWVLFAQWGVWTFFVVPFARGHLFELDFTFHTFAYNRVDNPPDSDDPILGSDFRNC